MCALFKYAKLLHNCKKKKNLHLPAAVFTEKKRARVNAAVRGAEFYASASALISLWHPVLLPATRACVGSVLCACID